MNLIHFLKKLTVLYAILFAFVFLFISFVAQPFQVTGASMYPLLKEGELVLIDKISLRFGENIKKGDILAFLSPSKRKEILVKRVAASPGEVLSLRDSEKLKKRSILPDHFAETMIRMGDNEFYMMGDNAKDSIDSRAFGPVGKEQVIGKVRLILWPPQKIKLLRFHPLEWED